MTTNTESTTTVQYVSFMDQGNVCLNCGSPDLADWERDLLGMGLPTERFAKTSSRLCLACDRRFVFEHDHD